MIGEKKIIHVRLVQFFAQQNIRDMNNQQKCTFSRWEVFLECVEVLNDR